MTVLVAHASKHGATAGIAERIAAGLVTAGWPTEVRPIDESLDASGYQAFVIGSAVYSAHWLPVATRFVTRNLDVLADRPVWLFSSGPLGDSPTDAKGRDLRQAAAPGDLIELQERVHPRSHRVFFGAMDPGALTLPERARRRLPGARVPLPEGDFRDWAEIEHWAAEIAAALGTATAGA